MPDFRKEVGAQAGYPVFASTPMIVHISRFLFVTTGALSGFAVSRLIDWSGQTDLPEYTVIVIFIILGWSIGYLLGGIVGRELTIAYDRLEDRFSAMPASDILLGLIGLLAGLAVAFMAFQPLRLVHPTWLAIGASGLFFLMSGFTGVRIALVKRRDFASAVPWLSHRDDAGGAQTSVKYLDTSAVIDGRFAELASLGLLEGDIRVPRFVLVELQTLADSADDIKRARGRRGLDLLSRLQGTEVEVEAFEVDYPDMPRVDDKLMKLAAETGGTMITVDYNLTKVAEVRGIGHLNLNDVAMVLRPAFLPGEVLRLQIVRPGKETGQGVGYLEDGTMVVVQDGADHLDTLSDAEVTSVLQTSAGRMIFARFIAETEDGA